MRRQGFFPGQRQELKPSRLLQRSGTGRTSKSPINLACRDSGIELTEISEWHMGHFCACGQVKRCAPEMRDAPDLP